MHCHVHNTQYICGLFCDIKDFQNANFADDNTAYTSSPGINSILKTLLKEMDKMFEWFSQNVSKTNVNKVHLITSYKFPVELQVSNVTLVIENRVKHFGIHIENRLNFHEMKMKIDFHENRLSCL